MPEILTRCAVLCCAMPGVIGGVHLLPVYPSSGDGGFAPLNYSEVDPHFGTWEGLSPLCCHTASLLCQTISAGMHAIVVSLVFKCSQPRLRCLLALH